MELLADGAAEVVFRADYCGVQCQSRVDWINPQRGIVDLKTCDDMTWFESDAKRYCYANQMAFYRSVVAASAGGILPVHLIAVEKKQPYRCGVWLIGDNLIAAATQENEAAIARLSASRFTNIWPTGYEEPRVMETIA
jgi:hypothetical protein